MNLQELTANDGRILVVDDVPSALKVVTRLLKKLGVTNVIEARNGTAALAALASEDVRLIISDWNMPGMNGLQLLTQVRSDPKLVNLPFILITSSADRDEVVLAYKTGVSDYIVKPFNGDTLAAKIQSVLTAPIDPTEGG